jgi:hypothetical protein
MEATQSYPRGPLSLLYHLTNSEDVRSRFKVDPSSVMTEFGLSGQAQEAVKAAGDDMTSERIAGVLSFVQAEIEQRAEVMW